jgi:propanol-preferring alcohol dehydrogenase
MRAMQLDGPGGKLQLVDVPIPLPAPGEVLVAVSACGVCRTDLHVVDGDISDGKYPVIPGHQIVGRVVESEVATLPVGQRVGIPWLGYTCGQCEFCAAGMENLCDAAQFTGYQRQGGYAEFVAADARFCFVLPDSYPDLQAAPLLCAGLIGYRALRMTQGARKLGFYGFGNAAHILTQIARHEGREVYALTREGDLATQEFALGLGARWAGDITQPLPVALDGAIIFAPAGELVPLALRSVRKGGCVICAGIHMTDIPSFPYADLWGERSLKSVANLTREDGLQLLQVAPQVPVRTQVSEYSLADLPVALADLRDGRIEGAAVITLQ